MKVKGKKLAEMSVESFFENIDDLAIVDDETNESTSNGTSKETKKAKKVKKEKKLVLEEPSKVINKERKKKKKVKDPADVKNEEKSLKKYFKNLDKIDPELHKFLEQNDKKLMSFNINDDGEDEDETKNESESDEDENDTKNGNLEVASDESDFEPEENEEKKRKNNSITLEMLREWQKNLQSEEVSVEVIRSVIKAFNSALLSISSEANSQGEYRVEGSAIFNGIIQLCVLYLEKALKNYLKLGKKANFKEIQKCKRFSKLKNSLRSYLTDLTKLLENVASSNILSVVLKHLHQIASILTAFTSITKPILKRLIQIWSTGEESVRIVAFLCILKITMNHKELFLNQVLKTMYMEYVKNSKFVSPNTLPAINFMRRSLTELFLLDLNVAYHHVFLFIRQLAIHLRNAILLQKKEHFQQIYNWQYVNSLKLWGDVLSTVSINVSPTQPIKADNKSKLLVSFMTFFSFSKITLILVLQALIYPLVSIINGVIKLKSSAPFFPLRFHCVKILIDISRSTKIYIPILPYILEVLNSNTFNQQHKKLSMKPLSFTCILRIQKGHLDENAFRDEVIEQVFGLTLECLMNECTSIAFPDLVVPHIMTLNHFIKNTKNQNYSKKLKSLVDKIQEQSEYIDSRRNKITFSLNDANYVKSWEINQRTGETPLEVFHEQWQNSTKQKQKQQKMSTIEDEDPNYDQLPKIKALPPKKKAKLDDKVELFPSDDEDDDGMEINFEGDSDDSFNESDEEVEVKPSKKKNEKVKNKKEKVTVNEDESSEDDYAGNDTFMDNGDIVEDINDW